MYEPMKWLAYAMIFCAACIAVHVLWKKYGRRFPEALKNLATIALLLGFVGFTGCMAITGGMR